MCRLFTEGLQFVGEVSIVCWRSDFNPHAPKLLNDLPWIILQYSLNLRRIIVSVKLRR